MTENIDEIIDKAQAVTYLNVARRCVENARARHLIPDTMRITLGEMYDVLDFMIDELCKGYPKTE